MVIPYDPPYNICTVDFVSGSRLLLDMKPHLDKIRFHPLADARVWNSAVTNGIFVCFDDVGYEFTLLDHDTLRWGSEFEFYQKMS